MCCLHFRCLFCRVISVSASISTALQLKMADQQDARYRRIGCVLELLTNPQPVFKATSEVLLKLANNILENPNDAKYRSVRVGSTTFTEKLLPVPGALECLFAMGFEEDGEKFTFPENKDTSDLTFIRDALLSEQNTVQFALDCSDMKINFEEMFPEPPDNPSSEHPIKTLIKNADKEIYPSDLVARESRFLAKLEGNLKLLEYYEDPENQRKAKCCIPVKELEEKANEKLKNLNKSTCELNFDDILLLELMKWFKDDFFCWIDTPKCNQCGDPTKSKGMAVSNPEEQRWDAYTVELYECKKCQKEVRFPRYNHPAKLLETRGGRCGEWANCFALCCRALGLETRYVVDWGDHVWNEVFSTSQNGWIHCDPCENVCNKPLLYEIGWKKKMSYVIAFSKDEIVDVSWRYSTDYDELRKRRNECRESWLLTTLQELNQKIQKTFSTSRRELLIHRQLRELADFLTPPKVTEGLGGRTSGSLEWRLARGETTDGQLEEAKPYTFKPTKQEIECRKFHVRYSTVSDKYMRVCSNEELEGWQYGTFEYSNMDIKVERDWKMVYLARTEGSDKSSISWNFDFRNCGLIINTVQVLCQRTVFENGVISCTLCSEDRCLTIPEDINQPYFTEELKGMQTMKLQLELSGGRGDIAWQHTQLFRLPLTAKNECGFEIIVAFIPEN